MSKHHNRTFEIVKCKYVEDCIEIWLPPVDHPEGALIVRALHKDYLPALIADIKNHLQNSQR